MRHCSSGEFEILRIRIFQASEHLRLAEDFRERQRVAMEKAINGEGGI